MLLTPIPVSGLGLRDSSPPLVHPPITPTHLSLALFLPHPLHQTRKRPSSRCHLLPGYRGKSTMTTCAVCLQGEAPVGCCLPSWLGPASQILAYPHREGPPSLCQGTPSSTGKPKQVISLQGPELRVQSLWLSATVIFLGTKFESRNLGNSDAKSRMND